jgi:hypothetical protein
MRPGPHRFWKISGRRPSFWLGFFVACFLAWAWWDSYRHTSLLSWGGSKGLIGILREDGATFVFKYHDSVAGTLLSGWDFTRAEPLRVGTVWDYLKTITVSHGRAPDSLVFFSFLGLWVGWLAFSDCRRKKRAQRMEPDA